MRYRKQINRRNTMITKPIGQLIVERHWSVEGLEKKLNLTEEDKTKWAKSKMLFKKSKMKSTNY